MAYDEGLAQALRAALSDLDFTEKKMFGGLCFLHRGNMVCGVHNGGAMMRVGKSNEAAALAVEGVGPMLFTGKPMGGMIDVSPDTVADDERLSRLMALAVGYVRALPPK